MIWYLLYPFRGTTEAPVLDPTHPLRNAFTRYGTFAARHVVTTLLISVTVATILIYPFPFLFTTDFTNGASNLPHHVWTVAQPLGPGRDVEPDVIMRSIWVHGSYMKALERDVLLGALTLQDELLGSTKDFNPKRSANYAEIEDPFADLSTDVRDTFHVINGLSDHSWFFHSPLQYWSCDEERIADDQDIIETVNQGKTQPTSVNVTLRHSIVFSGKRFEDRRLLAADALVITLIHRRDSPVGQQWERKARLLAEQVADKWDVYPADGIAREPDLYEFQFRPMSTIDLAVLALAYLLTFLYFMMSLSKLRAFKSKTGLMITVVAQTIVSIMSSFVVCASFKVDLSRIPHAAYPVVVLSMSLENVFRLINAVISTPAEDNVSARIGAAFGETAHVGLASSLQNVAILWGLSHIVTYGVAEFCTFVAVAIVFDFFYLSTFFLSVLSVDVRRTELSDALAKASLRNNRRSTEPPRPSWSETMLQGKLALSTRVAGTIIMVAFVVIAQWHFFENESLLRVVARLFKFSGNYDLAMAKESVLIDIHQARTPTSWLRLQDHDTAKEVIHVIKPDAHSYVAQVFRPVVFVAKGADRSPIHERPLLPALYDFFRHQLTPFIASIILVIAAIRLLTSYLLWEEESDASDTDGLDHDRLVNVKPLIGGHALDIAMMTASADGQIVSVGLDRLIRVWNIRQGIRSYIITEIEQPDEDIFPILAMTIDNQCLWLGLLSSYKIFLWNLVEHRWGPSIPIDLYGQKPEAFFFSPSRSGFIDPLVVVRRNGTMMQLWPEENETMDFIICKSPLVSAWPLMQKSTPTRAYPQRIVTASRKGCIHVATQQDAEWRSDGIEFPDRGEREAYQVVPLASLGAFLIARARSVDFVDVESNRVLHTFQTDPIQPRTLRCQYVARRKPSCGSIGVAWLNLVYTSDESLDCIVQQYLPDEDGDLICFRNSGQTPSSTCCPIVRAKEARKHIENPGSWEALPNGSVIGVRNKSAHRPSRSGDSSPQDGGLRRRTYRAVSEPKAGQDSWEVWVYTRQGRLPQYETRPLRVDEGVGLGLMITELGPMVQVGTSTVAVGFGTSIKLVSVGKERFRAEEDGTAEGDALLSLSTRRRHRHGGTSSSRPRAALRI